MKKTPLSIDSFADKIPHQRVAVMMPNKQFQPTSRRRFAPLAAAELRR